jgi:2-methylcitrate dehydratase PrpD
MPDTLAGTLSHFAIATRIDGIDDALLHDAMERVLDTTGNAIAAVGEEPAGIALGVVDEMGGIPQSTIIGSGRRAPAANAALVNGTLAHALDFDDTHLPSVLHPSSSVIPAALAVSQAVGASGHDTLTAIAVGIEITVRLGMASYDSDIRNSIFFENGLHATSIVGTLGSAVAAAMLYGLSEDEVQSALGIAASMGAGLLEANRTGGSVKRIHCGWAAHSGVTASLFARGGLTGPPTVLEGRFGFFRAYSKGRFDEEAIVGGLGDDWELPKIFYKPYPTNHFTHAGIDAALKIRARGITSDDIVAIELGVPEPVMRTIAEPADQKKRPLTPYHAKFSGPFTVATALVGGGGLGVYSNDFTSDTLQDPERLRLAALVRCVPDQKSSEIFPHQFPAVLTVTLTDGTEIVERIDTNRGGQDRPLTREEQSLKFRLNAGQLLATDQVADLQTAVFALVSAPSIDEMMALTHPGGGA